MFSKMIKTLAAGALMALFCLGLNAQTRTVSGVVRDAGNEPLMGIAVIQDGTTNGVMTGIDGDYSIRVPEGDVVLTFSSIGYKAQTISVRAAQAVVDVVLAEDNEMLDETVVVGYGTQKKVNLTGAISTVESKALENRSAHNLSTMLQGEVPGLNVSTSSGIPGNTGSLNIRGVTSINSADPIVLIDGAIGDISRVNPNDVESISVIKDAAAAAVYGARGAYGVILVTTKSGSKDTGKATVRYSGRFGWEEPTTSTDFETRGYYHVKAVDTFWRAGNSSNYTTYTDYDMAQLLARVNDKTENPDRPWVVTDVRGGKKQWVYYCNTDWYHELYNDRHPVQNHNVSISGGGKGVRYYLSANYDKQVGVVKVNPDVFQKANIRSKIDFDVNKYIKMSNNTSYFMSNYSWVGSGSVQDSFHYASRHAMASFPLQNPDGSWVYGTPMIAGSYNVANGRHIIFADGYDQNVQRKNDFSNTTQIVISPVKTFNVTGNVTYRQYQNRNTGRTHEFYYRRYPDADLESYATGAGLNELDESVATYNYISGNVFATYEETYGDAHHLKAMAGMNMETWNSKTVAASGQNILSDTLNDLNLVGTDATGTTVTTVSGGQNAYSLLGYFGRINYDYKSRYLFELSGRYDGSSRFAEGSRWGFFPSASAGWRISEEPFFRNARTVIDNLKLRASYGSLGNQNVGYYDYLRLITISNYSYSFGEGSSSLPKKATLSKPVSSGLTWETSQQYNVGFDLAAFKGRLDFTAEAYIRDTKDMLTEGVALPSVYGADAPQENAADLRTKGYELSLGWRDQVQLFGKPFGYSLRATLSDYRSYITKYDNPNKTFAKDYYEGQRLGDIWGFVVDGLFETDQEAQDYNANVCDALSYIGTSRMVGGFRAGDLRYIDLDGDGKLGVGANTVDDPGDRKILGNSLPSLQYGFTLGFDYLNFDFSAFLQGTANHYWYPSGMNYAFWGLYGYSYASFVPRDYMKTVWSEENTDTYFPRPRTYSSTGGELRLTNSRYIQNIRYLRFKNLSVGYTIPQTITKKAGLDKVRVYFTGENIAYWSPITRYTKYLDPESAFRRDTSSNTATDGMEYPWQKTYMFGIDITF